MTAEDAEWHQSFKPSFANNGTLVYSVPGSAPPVSGELATAMQGLVGEHKDVRFAKFVTAPDINPMTLLAQKEVTSIDTTSGFPAAHAPHDLTFASLVENIEPELPIADHEKAVWTLCSIMFDPTSIGCAPYMVGVPEDKVEEFETQMRVDAFGAFWAEMVTPFVQDGLKRARSAEEKALLCLTQNDIVAACEALMVARDFKLATLVSQLPGTASSRAMMQTQIADWRTRNDWSEMSEPVRALFTILAGQVCVVEGKTGAVENRAAEFNIAERIGLSWQQSFALRLFFGGHDTITEAYEAYEADLESARERIPPSTTRPDGKEIRDTIMDLLRLCAGQYNLTPLLDPLAISGSAVNSRLTWQLASVLNAKGISTVPNEELDQITYDFATELELAGKLVSSAWILLHIRDNEARKEAIVGLVERNGNKISTPGPEGAGGSFEELVQDNKIPASFVWRAKALYAKAGLRDPHLQTTWLLQAGDVDEAHEVLCTTLGPQAVIGQDYDELSNIVQRFPRHPPNGWQTGGQVYTDFVRLVRAHVGQRWTQEAKVAMQRLKRGLGEMEGEGRKKSLSERVAVHEMWAVLGEVEREHGGFDGDRSLGGMEFEGGAAASAGAHMLERYQRAMGMVA